MLYYLVSLLQGCLTVSVYTRLYWRCIYTYNMKLYEKFHESKNSDKLTTEEKYTGKLEGKIAVITGGNSGIGLATAQRFVDEGADVFIVGRRQSEINAAVNQIGKNVFGVQGDVSNLADLDRLYDSVKQQKARIDVLFANAGIAEFAPLGSITESHFDKIFNINVKGLLFTVQKGAPAVSRGWFYYSNFFGRRIQRNPGV